MRASREEDLMTIVKTFLATLNAHNVDAALAFFTDGAALRTNTSFAPLGSEIAIGKQQIRSHLLGILPGFRIEKCWNFQVSGNAVTWASEWSDDFFRNLGIDSEVSTIEAVFEGNKIKHWTLTMSPETVEKLWASLEE